jgi:3',5'-cyclic-AMP phosphodiesterase
VKIYLISDIHLMPPGELSHGIDTAERFQRALDDLEAHHGDAALCVILGDLADHGEISAYQVLRQKLARVTTPVVLLIGNHDSRAQFLEVFPERGGHNDGFVHSVRDTEFGRLIFLDTYEPDYVTGRLCEKRLAWLGARLKEAAGKPVYLFLHHPPFDTGGRVDGLKLTEARELGDLLLAHGNVRQIVCGHTHRVCSGAWRSIPFTNLGATTYNLGMHPAGEGWGIRHTGSVFTGVMLLSEDNVVVHAHDLRPDNHALTAMKLDSAFIDEIIARNGKLTPEAAH